MSFVLLLHRLSLSGWGYLEIRFISTGWCLFLCFSSIALGWALSAGSPRTLGLFPGVGGLWTRSNLVRQLFFLFDWVVRSFGSREWLLLGSSKDCGNIQSITIVWQCGLILQTGTAKVLITVKFWFLLDPRSIGL